LEASCLDDSKTIQNLTNDLQRFEFVTKNVEGVIASARAAIAKAQTLICDNEQKLANEKKKVEKLEATKSRVQQELDVHTSRLEALQAQLASKKFFVRGGVEGPDSG